MIYYTNLKNAYLSPLISYFQKFHWLHPRLFKVPQKQIYTALKEGTLLESERRPWLYPCPELYFSARPQSKPGFSFWERLHRGPAAHESMIYRVGFSLFHLPGSKLTIDDSLMEVSLPSAWGGYQKIVPDVLVEFENRWNIPLWIECERHFKNTRFYENRIKILRAYRVIYIVPTEKVISFLSKVEHLLSKQFMVMDEKTWIQRARSLGRKQAKLQENLCLVGL